MHLAGLSYIGHIDALFFFLTVEKFPSPSPLTFPKLLLLLKLLKLADKIGQWPA
jgi:hypothetical protein